MCLGIANNHLQEVDILYAVLVDILNYYGFGHIIVIFILP